MRVLTTFLLFSLLPLTAQTAGEKEAIGAVQHLFDAMAAKDGAAIRSAMMDDARVRSVRGDTPPTSSSVSDFVARIAGFKTSLQERFSRAPHVQIRGRLAQVWGEYTFLLDGKADHCGIDSISLFRTAEGWKIAEVDFTSEPCSTLGR